MSVDLTIVLVAFIAALGPILAPILQSRSARFADREKREHEERAKEKERAEERLLERVRLMKELTAEVRLNTSLVSGHKAHGLTALAYSNSQSILLRTSAFEAAGLLITSLSNELASSISGFYSKIYQYQSAAERVGKDEGADLEKFAFDLLVELRNSGERIVEELTVEVRNLDPDYEFRTRALIVG